MRIEHQLGSSRVCLRTLEQADQLPDQIGVKAGIEFIGQQDRPLGKRLDNGSDQAEPDERTERLILRGELNVAACALVDEA